MGRSNYVACSGDTFWGVDNGPMEDNLTRSERRAVQSQSVHRGVFIAHQDVAFRDILDGLSNTIIMGEIATDLGDLFATTTPKDAAWTPMRNNPASQRSIGIDPERPSYWESGTAGLPPEGFMGRGFRWAQQQGIYGQMNTIYPPNSPLIVGNFHRSPGFLPPSSRHQGGCHILMSDGAVKFITDSIEAGDQTATVVWQNARGTQNAAGVPSPYGLWGALGTRATKEILDGEF